MINYAIISYDIVYYFVVLWYGMIYCSTGPRWPGRGTRSRPRSSIDMIMMIIQ